MRIKGFINNIEKSEIYVFGKCYIARKSSKIKGFNNALEAIPQKLAEAEQKLETVQGQLKNAMVEVKKPFPKEEELNQKLERLSELNALLNMDEKETAETQMVEVVQVILQCFIMWRPSG